MTTIPPVATDKLLLASVNGVRPTDPPVTLFSAYRAPQRLLMPPPMRRAAIRSVRRPADPGDCRFRVDDNGVGGGGDDAQP